MNVKVKELSLRYGLFEVSRGYGDIDNCVVMRKNNTLYFHTDVNEEFEELMNVVDGYEWKCGVELFKRIIERLTSGQEYENGSGRFTHEQDDGFDIQFMAPCGEVAYVKLATLVEVAEKFGGNGEEKT